ncbi:carboxylesterase/lipase family protein [Gordonia insulae]|uniref:Carboxylic ester hydrolase n=1 Tax=Gordonia insulae TaxID=2420509 RepID=A0A3G8JN91_9ACTN|nr:carboxylesterase family protein [Gordonia insulae]AZG46546.1 Para-nitrobenzyl esterase [Gordonia insulae]
MHRDERMGIPGRTASTTLAAAGLILSALLVAASLAGCSPSADGPAPLRVSTTSGELTGIRTAHARQFLGVRYAQPPIGERRWRLPRPIATPSAQVDAGRAGSPCPQTAPVPGDHPAPSEDCLSLNVTTPQSIDDPTGLPVMVWWHGGGYTTGAGSAYDPQRLADRGNVIVVTVNYRLGMFGYLNAPGLDGGGDFGFADQIESLRWIKANARAFGGDPGNVTVFGQSAGSLAACALMTSPAAHGLIDRAILASGSCMLNWPAGALFPEAPAQTPYAGRSESQATSAAAARQLGCAGESEMSCMRGLSTDRLLTQNEDFGNQLTYGTGLLPRDPAEAIADGRRLAIPVITGGTHDEHRSFIGGLLAVQPDAVTRANYPDLVRKSFGDRAPEVLARYPLAGFPSPGVAWATVVTDASWTCPTLRGAQFMSRSAPTFAYEFADTTAPNVNGVTTIPQNAAHATDLPYYFDLGGKNLLTSPRQREIADQMIDYWSSFARDETPHADGAPDMVQATENSHDVLRLGTSSTEVVDVAADHHCGFWG